MVEFLKIKTTIALFMKKRTKCQKLTVFFSPLSHIFLHIMTPNDFVDNISCYHQSSYAAYPMMADAFSPKCHIRFLSQGSEYKLEAKVWLHEMS